MDNLDFMAEVDAQISKILKNKSTSTVRTPQTQKENEFCDGTNLDACLEHLSQEFDYLDCNAFDSSIDLSTKKGLKNTLIQLVNSSYKLVKLQQETQQKYNQNCDANTSNQSEIIYLRKINESLRKELKTKESHVRLQQERQFLENLKTDDVNLKLTNAKKEIAQLKKEQQLLINRHKNEVQRAQSEAAKITHHLRKNQENGGQILTLYEDLSKNDMKNRAIIEKLQMNNHELLEEVSQLRDQIINRK